MKDWSHDALAHDLAQVRRECGEMVAERLTLGPGYGRSGQADVFSIKPSWTKPMPTCWEVKVTRRDFLGDVRSAKFERYLPHCRKLYFATPAGLLSKDEIPDGMGLTVRGDNGWHVVKAPRLRKVEKGVHAITLMAMLMRLNGPMSSAHVLSREERVRRYAEMEDAASHLCDRVAVGLARVRREEMYYEGAKRKLARLLDLDGHENTTLDRMASMIVDSSPVRQRTQVPEAVKGAVVSIQEDTVSIQRALRGLNEAIRRTENPG